MTSAKAYKDAALAARLSDRYYRPRQDSDPSFTTEVEKIGGTEAHICFQCGTCTGSCPSAARSSYRIRNFMRRVNLGMRDVCINDPDLWMCTTCYTCADRCPRDLIPTDVIMAMRNIAAKQGIVPKNFLATVNFIYNTGHGVPNNDANRAARVKLGLDPEPETTSKYPEYLPAIRKILEIYGTKQLADKVLAEGQ
ncbi:MAG: CoB--CoM heterodisulfide reductase subunit C [Candidatus Methanomethylophilus sp.]|jgi:heterodisulfide reductase subunit C|nr:CoB--CoM heterodisulfide reductase subunit C [Methanomethylophilus sp.]